MLLSVTNKQTNKHVNWPEADHQNRKRTVETSDLQPKRTKTTNADNLQRPPPPFFFLLHKNVKFATKVIFNFPQRKYSNVLPHVIAKPGINFICKIDLLKKTKKYHFYTIESLVKYFYYFKSLIGQFSVLSFKKGREKKNKSHFKPQLNSKVH